MKGVTIARDENRRSLAPDVPVTLVTRSWRCGFAVRQVGVGASYQRPLRVEDERDGTAAHVRDHVMFVRMVAVGVVLAALTTRRLLR